jgi:DNA-binding Xre family transcriptional regulator
MRKLKNRMEELLIQKYGGKENIPSQEKLAVQIGLTQNTTSRWIRGKITRFDEDTLSKICDFLDCQVGDLIYFADTQEPA